MVAWSSPAGVRQTVIGTGGSPATTSMLGSPPGRADGCGVLGGVCARFMVGAPHAAPRCADIHQSRIVRAGEHPRPLTAVLVCLTVPVWRYSRQGSDKSRGVLSEHQLRFERA